MTQSLIDLNDRDFIRDPYPALSAMRESSPLIHDEASSLWLVTRHEDVKACLRDRRLGRIYDHVTTAEEIGASPQDPRWQAFWDVEKHSLLELEPPEHTRLRRLISKAFTVRAVAAMREPAARLAGELLEDLIEQDEIDLLADFAQPFSIGIITGLLGVPSADHRELLGWSHQMVKMYELNTSSDQAQSAADAAAEFDGYVRELIAFHRDEPRGGLVGELVHTEVEGERLTTEEIVSTTIVLLNAGHEATVNTMGNGITAFMNMREEWRHVVEGATTPAVAIEEMLRWDAPLQLFERWVLADDVAIAGTRLRFGDKIGMLFGSANRDPRAFEEPDAFRADRHATHHIGFGGGTHHCLGAPLARLELDVGLSALVHRAPEMELTAEPVRANAFTIHGYESVPVCLRPS
ncbi:MAG: cytochrome P450 [Acidimicrobiia bacterium]|nr:cytochrome P450 [Acidimicrobiia bacterium]